MDFIQLGKTANGQVFVTTHYADTRCHWPLDLTPYVPDTWLPQGKADPDFHTKIDLALDLVERAVARGLPFRAVVADSWYGRNMGFLKTLEQHGRPYVVELQPSQRVFVRLAGDLGRNEHRLVGALNLLTPKDFRPVGLQMADGTKREVHVARPRAEDQTAVRQATRRGGHDPPGRPGGRRGPAVPDHQRRATARRDGGPLRPRFPRPPRATRLNHGDAVLQIIPDLTFRSRHRSKSPNGLKQNSGW